MIGRITITGILMMLGSYTGQAAEPFRCNHLTINYRSEEVCVDPDAYRLGWSAEHAPGTIQTHYQVQMASHPDFEEGALIFDSNKKPSSASQNIRPGFLLPPQAILFWRVKIWDNTGAESAWSDPFRFFSSPTWVAKWISTRPHTVSHQRKAMPTFGQTSYKNPQDSIAAYLRKTFVAKQPVKSAHLYLSGLGYYELSINGQRIGSQVLDPAFSDYQKRVYFNAFEVSDQLQPGDNRIEVTLGNGFYNLYTQNLFMLDQSEWKAPHKLLFQLHIRYEDSSTQTIVSDTSWQWGTGPIVFNSIMGGETLDTRKPIAIDRPVVLSEGPGGVLTPQLIPAMQVNEQIAPVEIVKLDAQTYLVDFGRNITGSVALTIPSCPEGQAVKVFYNEALDSAGYLQKDYSKTHTRGRFQEDRLICNGKSFLLQNHFSYFGFRYAQVEHYPGELKKEDIIARSIHTPLESESVFQSSDRRINELNAAIKRTLKNSIHGMPGEEPTREKMGWTFDAGVNTMEPYLYYFNAVAPYEKYLLDLADAQAPGGHIPPIVPTNGWGFLEANGQPILYDDPWWGGTILYVMDELVSWTGDSAYYRDYYDNLKAYTDFVHNTADDSLIVRWSLGDWLDPENFKDGWGPGLTSVPLTSTLGLYYLADGTSQIAHYLGKDAESERYRQLAQKVKTSFLTYLYNKNELDSQLSQTGHALPLWLDVLDEPARDSAYQNLTAAIHTKDDHIYSGFIGIKPIMETLAEAGDRSLAFDMIRQEASPGWLHMVENEYSTMGENMNAEGYGTGHHPFGANIGYWFFKYLLGFRPAGDGWKTMRLAPFLPDTLDSISGTIHSPYGKSAITLKRQDSTLVYDITVPFNTQATFTPMDSIVHASVDYTVDTTGNIILPAGHYTFTSKISP